MKRPVVPVIVITTASLVGLAPIGADAAPVLFQGHHYETFVARQISWNAADVAANAMIFMGVSGHLATITSAAEDQFVDTLRQSTPGINLSGSFPNSELWVGGFQPPGSAEPGGGWQWVNAEGPFPGNNLGPIYANWLGGEPNNVGIGEAHLAIGIRNQFGWNDEHQIQSAKLGVELGVVRTTLERPQKERLRRLVVERLFVEHRPVVNPPKLVGCELTGQCITRSALVVELIDVVEHAEPTDALGIAVAARKRIGFVKPGHRRLVLMREHR